MLYDKEFLRQLDENRTRTVYARIVALTFDEIPVESIEGRVTQGSVNIDGSSAVRRTCSLSMIAQDYDYNAFLWGLNTKFTLEIGLENTINSNYPKIIWFKQGTYFISSFNTSHSTSDFTISIQGKDKMCALNGEIGGSLTSSVDFGTVEDIVTSPDGKRMKTITKLTLKEIIRNAVHLYGGEPIHNIIINDLDISGLELLEYRYDKPMYLYRSITDTIFNNITLDGSKQCKIGVWSKDENGNEIISQWLAFIDEEGKRYTTLTDDVRPIQLSDLNSSDLEMLVNPMTGTNKPNVIKIDDQDWYVAKINYGDTAGYRFTDLTYPGDLIGNIGESLTSILDKIKNMLGDYEYFYNLDGQFIFQRKKNSFKIVWSPEETNNQINQDMDIAYSFKDGKLITSFNNNPDLNSLRNDYSVWGERQGVSGKKLPVHMRYAIDIKPTFYKSLNNKVYDNTQYDWREIIYQMAVDYYAHTNDDDFLMNLAAANQPFYPNGKTGYENYYQDILGFWRDLYDPEVKTVTDINSLKEEVNAKKQNVTAAHTTLVQAQNNLQLISKDFQEPDTDTTKNTTQNDVDEAKKTLEEAENNYNIKVQELKPQETLLAKCDSYYYGTHQHAGWNKTVYEAPQNLNFWFDFLDTDGEMSQYSVKNVGCRPKAINDSNVKAIYFRETPSIVFTTNYAVDSLSGGSYTFINATNAGMNTMFTISAQGKSAKMAIDDLLYTHGYCVESTTINTIPIYYLEPNQRIYVVDKNAKIDGYYNISKLSIPLSYNGTMSITATKTADNI